ncbi:hypothetical protein [Pseudoxanthomonas dokdonensis]|uniref:Uncharacterized protein n=1 Tax=Pseudoxanthomonas dokdonensis TaxID=344882 RepID=A0A0R0CR26_9GAMM|nr:hypothetical protein [Pseudoxanthomonas dokdonensis]KRG68036.1 hypothetical protein ABB29_14775 [Pseudoxanthomonas dokdonensis]
MPKSPERNPESDQEKSLTPDRLRNNDAVRKDHDQPDQPRPSGRDPDDDYPDAGVPAPGKR